MLRLLLGALLLILPAAARADTTAVYTTTDGSMTMTIEIDANGDCRGEMGGSLMEEALGKLSADERASYPKGVPGFLTRGGVGYMLQPGEEGGIAVMPMADMFAILAEFAKDIVRPHAGEALTKAEAALVPLGTVEIRGRSGTAYGTPEEESPDLVISADPALAELARVMAGQFEMSTSAFSQMTSGAPASAAQMAVLLRTGAPLRLGPMELADVRHDPIPPERFELPAPPMTREAVRKAMQPRRITPGGKP